MKRSISTLMLALTALTSFAPLAHADRDGGGRPVHRYRSTYRDFDGGIGRQYGYNHDRDDCRESYNGGWHSNTCLHYQPTDYVYVQEEITDDGRDCVRVYPDQNSKSAFTEYYVYHEEVVRRAYYENGYYVGSSYTTERYVTTDWQINWNSGWGKIVGGFEVGAVGAVIVADGKGNTASDIIGGALIVAGAASSISGAKQLKAEKTELQASIAAEAAAANAQGTNLN
jgi:hypothetical protein